MIENILFPADFSPSCVVMAPYVKRAAAIFGSRVTLLHVCDLASHNGFELYVRSDQEIAKDHWNIARFKLDSFLQSEFPAAKYPRILRSGDAAEQIGEVAGSGRFDLIILPTHAGRFRRMLLGSTVAKVLNDVAYPVMTAQHAEMIAPRPFRHREWVCALALSEDSKRVLELANRGAAAAGARLTLIHVIHSASTGAQHDGDDEEEARRQIAELQKSVGCEARVCVVRGQVKEALLEAGKQCGADVLMIGRSPSKDHGRMSDFTYGVVCDSPFPVLSL